MEHVLQDLFKTLNEEAVKEVDAVLNKPSRSRFDFSTVSLQEIHIWNLRLYYCLLYLSSDLMLGFYSILLKVESQLV